jgi:hypothetical protein
MAETTGSADVQLLPWESGAATEATPEQSLFDALASEFEDEETPEGADEPTDDQAEEDDSEDEVESEDEEESEDGDDEEPSIEVTLPGGEKATVTLEELKKGYSRTQDYTRKTQALAEERKTLDAELGQIREVRELYGHRLQEAETFLRSQLPPEPDWATLRQENPAEFAAQWAEYQQTRQQIAAVQAERQKLEAQRQQDFAKSMESHLAAQRDLLIQKIPEWQDPEVSRKERDELVSFAKELGYDDEEISSVYDHRVLLILRDAYQYRKALKGAEKVKEKTAAAKVVQPGARQAQPSKTARKQTAQARQRLARSGNVTDAAAAIFGMLDD